MRIIGVGVTIMHEANGEAEGRRASGKGRAEGQEETMRRGAERFHDTMND